MRLSPRRGKSEPLACPKAAEGYLRYIPRSCDVISRASVLPEKIMPLEFIASDSCRREIFVLDFRQDRGGDTCHGDLALSVRADIPLVHGFQCALGPSRRSRR